MPRCHAETIHGMDSGNLSEKACAPLGAERSDDAELCFLGFLIQANVGIVDDVILGDNLSRGGRQLSRHAVCVLKGKE